MIYLFIYLFIYLLCTPNIFRNFLSFRYILSEGFSFVIKGIYSAFNLQNSVLHRINQLCIIIVSCKMQIILIREVSQLDGSGLIYCESNVSSVCCTYKYRFVIFRSVIFGIKVDVAVISLRGLAFMKSYWTKRKRNLYCSVSIPDAFIYGFVLDKFQISQLLCRIINIVLYSLPTCLYILYFY